MDGLNKEALEAAIATMQSDGYHAATAQYTEKAISSYLAALPMGELVASSRCVSDIEFICGQWENNQGTSSLTIAVRTLLVEIAKRSEMSTRAEREAVDLLKELDTWHGNDAGDRAISVLRKLYTAAAFPPRLVETALREALRGLIAAWDALPEGNYSPSRVERWLVDDMSPAINHARALLQQEGNHE